jgi:hypothetical protein
MQTCRADDDDAQPNSETLASASPSPAGLWLGYPEGFPVAALSLGGRLGCFGLWLRRCLRQLDLHRRRGRRRANGCDLDVLVARLLGFS